MLKQKRLRIIIILVVIAGFLLGIKLLFANKKMPLIRNLTPTPILSPTPAVIFKGDPDAPLQIRKEINQDYPLFQYIPYSSANWQIDYFKPLALEVKLKKDTPQVRQEVLNWIKAKNVDPSTHQINWVVSF